METIRPQLLATIRPQLLATIRPQLLATIRPQLLATIRPQLLATIHLERKHHVQTTSRHHLPPSLPIIVREICEIDLQIAREQNDLPSSLRLPSRPPCSHVRYSCPL
jgi:hypothetical protein